MNKTTNSFITALSDECKTISQQGVHVFLDEEVKDEYINNCDHLYKTYIQDYMLPGVETLDRHKIAGILTIEAIAINLIKPDKTQSPQIPDDFIFIGQEKIVLSCALRYMQREFNAIINGNFKQITSFTLPSTFSANVNYLDTLCRIQLHAKECYDSLHSKQIALMDLADRFFLMEYISIIEFYGMEKAKKIFVFLRNQHEAKSN